MMTKAQVAAGLGGTAPLTTRPPQAQPQPLPQHGTMRMRGSLDPYPGDVNRESKRSKR